MSQKRRYVTNHTDGIYIMYPANYMAQKRLPSPQRLDVLGYHSCIFLLAVLLSMNQADQGSRVLENQKTTHRTTKKEGK